MQMQQKQQDKERKMRLLERYLSFQASSQQSVQPTAAHSSVDVLFFC